MTVFLCFKLMYYDLFFIKFGLNILIWETSPRFKIFLSLSCCCHITIFLYWILDSTFCREKKLFNCKYVEYPVLLSAFRWFIYVFFFKPTCGSDPNQIQALARWDAETETYKLKAGVHLEVLWRGGRGCVAEFK